MRRVLFLDIDGVLNSDLWNRSHQKEISEGTLIDELKVKILAQLVKETNVEIILHSGWRFWFGPELKPLRTESQRMVEMFAKEGFLWLKEHSDVVSWVVLDDLDLHNIQVRQHQVKTDRKVGLTPDDIKNAERILSAEVAYGQRNI